MLIQLWPTIPSGTRRGLEKWTSQGFFSDPPFGKSFKKEALTQAKDNGKKSEGGPGTKGGGRLADLHKHYEGNLKRTNLLLKKERVREKKGTRKKGPVLTRKTGSMER